MRHATRARLGTLPSAVFLSALTFCSAAAAQQAQSDNSSTSETAPSAAQKSSGGPVTLTTVMVTATRRTTSIQDTPISMSADTGAQLQNLGITDPTQLSRMMSNVYVTQGYGSGDVRYSIRGMSTSDYSTAAVSPVAVYVDDVYQAYTFGVGNQLFDLERVEVLKGPQGTLFGMNTTGGAVRYISAPPTQNFNGYVDVDGGGGEFGHYAVEGMLNVPLVSDELYSRIDFRATERNDYVLNEYNGEKYGHELDYAGRGQLLWKAGEDTRVNLELFGTRHSGDGAIWHGYEIGPVCATPIAAYFECVNGQPTPSVMSPTATSSELRPTQIFDNFGATLTVQHDMDGYTLKSISAGQSVQYHQTTNDDGISGDFFHSIQQFHAWQGSQELRLTTPADRRVSGVAGLFAMYDTISQQNTTGSTAFGPLYDYMQVFPMARDTRSLAVYGSMTVHATRALSFILGLRGSNERQRIDLRGIDLNSGLFNFSNYGVNAPGTINEATLLAMDPLNPPFPVILNDCANAPTGVCDAEFSQDEAHTWKDLSWDATADYRLTPNAMVYFRSAKGYRSGGYNTYAATGSLISTVNPETVLDYEGGIKTDWLGERLRVNADVFYYDYNNQQVESTNGSSAGTRLSNAGRSRMKGAELEIDAAPVAGLRLQVSGGYTDARYATYDTVLNNVPISLAGNVLPYAPKWTGSGLASYTWNLGRGYATTVETDWSYQARVYFDPFDALYTSNGGTTLGNARVTVNLPWGHGQTYWVSAYVKNVTDKQYYNWGYFVAAVNAVESYGDLRTFGVELHATF